MMTISLMALAILLIHGNWVSAEHHHNHTNVELLSNKQRFAQIVKMRLNDLWAKYVGEESEDTFIGRCFGVARKLKMVLPMMVFKLGVIITILAFLTIFSLKGLGLLGLLLLINVSGVISKLTAAFAGKHDKSWKQPQTVHFHVHQDKAGFVEHTHPSAWEDRIGVSGSDEELNNSQLYNLYYRLNRNPLLTSYRDLNNKL